MYRLILPMVAMSLAAATIPATAGSARGKSDGIRQSGAVATERQQRKQHDSTEHDRAQSCDSSRQYAAYPDWARIAFSCGNSGGK